MKATSGIKLPVLSKPFLYAYPIAVAILVMVLVRYRQQGDEGEVGEMRQSGILVLGSSDRALGIALICILALLALSIPFGIVVDPSLTKIYEKSRYLDQDGDGHIDDRDWYPLDAGEWEDLDRDGIPDNSDDEVARFMTRYAAGGVIEYRYIAEGVKVFSEIDLNGDGVTE